MKGRLQLVTTREMKTCIPVNFIRRHEICRVWEVSLSQYPSQCLRVFGDKTLVKENVLPPYTINLRFNLLP